MQRYWSRKLSHRLHRYHGGLFCSFERKTTAAKTAMIKNVTFDDERLHLSILFSLFKTASQRICNETKNTM